MRIRKKSPELFSFKSGQKQTAFGSPSSASKTDSDSNFFIGGWRRIKAVPRAMIQSLSHKILNLILNKNSACMNKPHIICVLWYPASVWRDRNYTSAKWLIIKKDFMLTFFFRQNIYYLLESMLIVHCYLFWLMV